MDSSGMVFTMDPTSSNCTKASNAFLGSTDDKGKGEGDETATSIAEGRSLTNLDIDTALMLLLLLSVAALGEEASFAGCSTRSAIVTFGFCDGDKYARGEKQDFLKKK